MARYWVGDAGEHGQGAEPSVPRPRPAPAAPESERLTDALRRTLAGNVTADDQGE
jgi:hypothetical protein